MRLGIKVEYLYIRADVLEPEKDSWNLYEIKASNKVKKEHYTDVAFQKFVCIKAGLKINKCFVIHLNGKYVKYGEIKPDELIMKEDVTEKVNSIVDIEKNIRKYLEIIKGNKEPEKEISKNCTNPYECPMKEKCWNDLPDHNVFEITPKKAWELYNAGHVEIQDIPSDYELTSVEDQIIVNACNENKTHISKESIRYFLDSLHYPLYYFDFETINPAVPIFDRSKPYQIIPFQYSLHIQCEEGNTKHFEFLNDDNNDPRPKLLESLKNQIGTEGSVVVFSKGTESGILKRLAENFPEHQDWIENVRTRIIDLALPFRSFYYYNPSQKGSCSLKEVLPAIIGRDYYSELEINNGEDASILYFYSHIESNFIKKEEIRQNLLKYCCLDIKVMVLIVKELKKLLEK